MFIFSMAMWPVYVAGIQIITTEIAAGRRIGFFTALNDAVRFWPPRRGAVHLRLWRFLLADRYLRS